MNPYPAEQAWRQTATMLLRLIAFVVFVAAVIGLGWAVWDYLISNPLPYRDPEAIRAETTGPTTVGRHSELAMTA